MTSASVAKRNDKHKNAYRLLYAMGMRAGLRLCLIVVLVTIMLLALVVFFFSSYTPKTTAELCGTYTLDCELVEEELNLYPDGTFIQTAIIKSTSENISSVGRWTFATRTNRGSLFGDVTLDGFMAVLKWPDELNQDYSHPVIAVLPAEYWFGRILLGGRVDSWPVWKQVK